jgi:RND family efflux transporter MFP subunit
MIYLVKQRQGRLIAMNQKAALLQQLRIDRTDPPTDPDAVNRRRWLLAIGAVLVLSIVIASWWYVSASSRIQVHSVVAQAAAGAGAGSAPTGGSLLDASGYVVALREATVSGKAIYKVIDVLIQEGQAVKQGEVIARLDDTNARAALEQSRAQVKQLEAALSAARIAADDARPIYLRNQKQLQEGLISPETFDDSKSVYDAAEAGAKVAEGNLQVAQAAVAVNQRFEDDTVVKAPFDGVVTVKNAQPGEIISPQFSGGGGIAKIVDMDSLEVDVDVSESFINRVHPKQPAKITLNAYPDNQYAAEVIAVIPTADRAKATVKVRVAFKDKDARIVPEMGARVSFLEDAPRAGQGIAAVSPGVLIPAEAVQSNGETGTVYLINGETVERRAVRLGANSGGTQTILAGLPPGAQLAVGDFSKLHDGAKIRIVN